jgi:hypothetical protein
MKGIAWTVPVRIAREQGFIMVNLYNDWPMTRAVKRARKKGALFQVRGTPRSRAVFRTRENMNGGIPQPA